MNPRFATLNSRTATTALAVAIALGIAGDVLLRAHGAVGLGATLWIIVLVGAALAVGWNARWLSRDEQLLLLVAVAFALCLSWRDSDTLKLLDGIAIATALALPAARAGSVWIRRAGITDYLIAQCTAGVETARGMSVVVRRVDTTRAGRLLSNSVLIRNGGAVLRGVLIAAPVVGLFAVLLMSADEVFARIVVDVVRVDLRAATGHVLVSALIAWLSGGYLLALMVGARGDRISATPGKAALGATEVALVLALVNTLFVAFLIVQARYFFGGADRIEVTPGLTYATYARDGFFELVSVAALVLPLLLTLDWLFVRSSRVGEWVFRALSLMQVTLLFAIMASALMRMRLYQSAFGQTELRFYATAFMFWLAVVFVWFTATVLRGRRYQFAFGALVTGFAAVAGLNLVNPNARIIAANTQLLETGQSLDVRYATSLGADSAPQLLSAMDAMPDATRCQVAEGIAAWAKLERSRDDWRNWSYAKARALKLTARERSKLAAVCVSAAPLPPRVQSAAPAAGLQPPL